MSTVVSKINKLRAMSSRELYFRLAEQVHGRYEAGLHAAGLSQPHQRQLESAAARLRPAVERWWLPRPERDLVAAALRERAGEYVERTVEEARAVCRGELAFFGRTFSWPGGFAWHDDPVSGRPWPKSFHSKVDIFSGNAACGDVKFVWEVNRFQFLPTLGKAYCLTGDEDFARRAVELIADWDQANPYKVGVNWASMLELAVRSLAWLWTMSLIDGSRAFDASAQKTVTRSLLLHGQQMAEHLSTYFSPYNHLVGEATALHAIGTVLGDLPVAARWRDLGLEIMWSEVGKQFHADGGTVEQAFGYHHFTLGFYLQSWLLAARNGQACPAPVRERLVAAAEFSGHVTRPDGLVPMVGDADEGKALALEQAHPWDFRPYQAIAAAMFDLPSLRAAAGPFPPDVAWLVGAEAWRAWDEASTGRVPEAGASTLLPHSGYVVMRAPDASGHATLFDVGDIAHGVPENDEVSAAHGHADLLALEVSAHGAARLVDPGFFTYNGPVEWHRHFREAAAHNTLVVDGGSHGRYRGRLKWSNGSSARLTQWATSAGADCAAGEHDAFRDAGVRHRRAVMFLKSGVWIVCDWAVGNGTHHLDRYFHFSPGPVDRSGTAGVPALWTADPRGGNLLLSFAEPDAAIDISEGAPVPEGGWVAPRYEQKDAAAVARVGVQRACPAPLVTVMLAVKGLPHPGLVPRTSVTTAGETLRVSVALADGSGIEAGFGPVEAAEDIRSDAVAWAVTREPGGRVTSAFAADGTYLAVDGHVVIEPGERRTTFIHRAGQAPDIA